MRLRICAAIAETDAMDYSALNRLLGVSNSVLSKHLARLEDAGVVEIRKVSRPGHLWTRVGLTAAGREAYAAHIAALRTIVGL
jgi:DNA-binding MarR family transcriptional regulator